MRQAWAIRWVRECVLVPERFRDHCPDRYHVDAFPSILRGKQKALCAQWYRMLRIPLGSSWFILAFVEVERRHFCGHHVDVLKIFSRKLQYGIGIFTGQSPIGRIGMSGTVPSELDLVGHLAQWGCDFPLRMDPLNHVVQD